MSTYLATTNLDISIDNSDSNNERRSYRFANGLQIETGRVTSDRDTSISRDFLRSFSERPIMVGSWRWTDSAYGEFSVTPSSNSSFTYWLKGSQPGLRGGSYIAIGRWK